MPEAPGLRALIRRPASSNRSAFAHQANIPYRCSKTRREGNDQWKLQIDSGYVTRFCINFVAVRFVRDDLVGLFAGSNASDNEYLLVTQASIGGNKWPIRWSN
jgi:hypothetical protein